MPFTIGYYVTLILASNESFTPPPYTPERLHPSFPPYPLAQKKNAPAADGGRPCPHRATCVSCRPAISRSPGTSHSPSFQRPCRSCELLLALSWLGTVLAENMAGWHRHLQSIIRYAVKRKHSGNASAFYHSKSSPTVGRLAHLQGQGSLCSASIPRPLYHYFQQLGFNSSIKLLADSSDAAPVPSPLTPVIASSSGKTEAQKIVAKPSKVQAVLKGIKQSPKKVNLVAALVRGMRVEDALLQLQVTVKRAAKTVYQVIHSARANAAHNHGLDPDRLLVAEAFVGKGFYKKRINYHAKGKCGIKVRPECRLTVILREITPEEEAEIARLRVSNFLKLTKRERRLVPHRLIETTPIWNRKSRSKSHAGATAA